MAGKGDKRRKNADDKKYADGWDLIWGSAKKKEESKETKKEE